VYDPVSRRRPGAEELLGSVGIPASSSQGRQIVRMLTDQVVNVELIKASVSHACPDLCHHSHAVTGQALRAATKRSGSKQSGVSTDGRQFDFLYLTNDGTRGPFVDTEYVEVRLIIVVMSLSSFFLLFSASPQNLL